MNVWRNYLIPVYLDDEVRDFVGGIAEQKKADMGQIDNDLLRSDMNLARVIQ